MSVEISNRSARSSAWLPALFCVAAFAATSAFAAPADAGSARVRYVKDSLSDPEAAAAVYQSINRAARSVCHQPDVRDLAAQASYRQCYQQAVDRAVQSIDATPLTALHRSRSAHSSAS